jgi:methylmalonyl-CoA mutase cobalamin-binding subunit
MSIKLDFLEFPIPSYEKWVDVASKNLKEIDLNKILSKDSLNGYKTKGFYTKNDNKIPDINQVLESQKSYDNKNSIPVEIIDALNSRFPSDSNSYTIELNNLTNTTLNPKNEISIALIIASKLFNKFENKLNLELIISVGSNFLIEIAKFRALRYLLIKLANLNKTEFSLNIIAESTIWNKSVLDKENNILRMTAEALSSKLGGANDYTFNNFDFNSEHEFSSRISKNILNVINYESSVGKLDNSADGSYYLEEMTYQIAKDSWIEFQKISEFSPEKTLMYFAFEVDKKEESISEELSNRKRVLVGVNKYPNTVESVTFESLFNNDFEIVKKQVEDFEIKFNSKAEIFILNFGLLSDYKARSEFASDFYKVGGFTILQSSAQELVEDSVNLVNMLDSKIIVICSSDKIYDEILIPLITGIKSSSQNKYLVLAGNPADKLEKLKDIGLDDFIFVKSNIIDKLEFALVLLQNEKELK